MNFNKAKTIFIRRIGINEFKKLQQTDKPKLRTEWSQFIDHLCKNKEITQKQAAKWPQIVSSQ